MVDEYFAKKVIICFVIIKSDTLLNVSNEIQLDIAICNQTHFSGYATANLGPSIL